MSIVLFEDTSWKKFVPLSFTRSLFDLKIGSLTTFEYFKLKTAKLLTRKYLEEITRQRHPDCSVNNFEYDSTDIFVNSLFFPQTSFFKKITKRKNFLVSCGDKILIARFEKPDYHYLCESVVNDKCIEDSKIAAERIQIDNLDECGTVFNWPWDIISGLKTTLQHQLKQRNNLPKEVKALGKNPIFIDERSKVGAGTVVDASGGAIYIGPNSNIAHSAILGPAHIGEFTELKPYSTVNNSYIGNNCRIGGEIDSSIILDYTNKSHFGYLGHSYVGEWVNIGANTTTSDLKMTYGTISMKMGNEKKNTGIIKLGSFFGDMSKTSIGTNIYCGTRIGISSHLYGIIANDIPSYVMYGQGIGSENAQMDISSAVKFQKRMMSRRNISLSVHYENMMKTIFDMTSKERKSYGVRSKKFTIS
jgi:UDP-N-acetylglucosamine diphosphorylase / glucose-1-phosphate thymidylyltransferase / UDP-N-acetylgalactosamine diphosphorylase / glucosamine-1-phosphate N-acetyltransferase / galactosamine-1-phosphate N-acetyltransferase